MCGSATKKRILREAFERNARTVDLSPDNVPDINVITGVSYLHNYADFLISLKALINSLNQTNNFGF